MPTRVRMARGVYGAKDSGQVKKKPKKRRPSPKPPAASKKPRKKPKKRQIHSDRTTLAKY